MIRRILEKKIRQLSGKMPVISITGPRQSGKTTLSKICFPEYEYVNLELPDNRIFSETDPRTFLDRFKNGVILDEIQNVPDLFSYIQVYSDQLKKSGRFILTGSQNFLLSEKISQSLAGRVAVVNLLPFSTEELNLKSYPDYEALIVKGFYPRVHDKNIDPADFYPSYIQTYVERDVRQIVNISSQREFQLFLKLCAGRIGQILNTTSLSNDLGVDQKTVKRWISILEASYIIFLLQPHSKNFNKRLIKSPKIYFHDTGLACSLLDIKTPEQLQLHYHKGNLFENFILSEIFKLFTNRFNRPQIYFWRDNTGNEIDCIIESEKGVKAIEIKSGKTINPDFFKTLNYYKGLSKIAQKNIYLIYGGNENQSRTQGEVINWKNLNRLI